MLCLLLTALAARAGDDIPVDALPRAVTSAVQRYFPSAKIIKASADGDDERTVYKLKAVYRESILEAEVFSDGRVAKFKSVDD
jgi:hypothetical protein